MIERTHATEVGTGRWGLVSRWIGPIDLHYHFRVRPLLKFFSREGRGAGARLLEFGCGAGDNLFKLKARLPSVTAVGVDIDPASIAEAQRLASIKGYSDLKFVCADTAGALDEEAGSFDYALLIDVLEHLHDPRALLEQIKSLLKPDGRILVSVPTHRYPRVFGREFHEAVGHVRDGFTMDELDELLGPSCVRVESSYNTGLIAGLACACFYRVMPRVRVRKVAIAGMIGLHLSRLLDVLNGASRSCSIWAVYNRRA